MKANSMKYIYTKILVILVVLLPFKEGFSQCTKLIKGLKQAERLYDNGGLSEAATLIDSLLVGINTSDCPNDIKKAKVLLTKLHLFMNQDSVATTHWKDALVIDPLYIPDTLLEPIDLFYFSRKYRTIPSRTISIELLSGFANIKKLENFYTTDVNIAPIPDAEPIKTQFKREGFGTGARVRMGYHLNSFFELSLGVEFDQRQYGIEYSLDYSSFNDVIAPNLSKIVHITERQRWWSIPLTARLNLSRKNVMGTLYCGGEYSYLANARLTSIDRGGVFEDTENQDFNVTSSRNSINLGLIAGAGLKFRPSKMTKNYITINFQWSKYLNPINDIENRFNYGTDTQKEYITQLLLFKYGFMDENIEMNYLQFSLCYELTKYRAIERKGRF